MPEAGCAILIVAALLHVQLLFAYWFNSSQNHIEAKMQVAQETNESHLECHLSLSYYNLDYN